MITNGYSHKWKLWRNLINCPSCAG